MKKSFFVAILVSISCFIFSCREEDKCENTVCASNETCIDGDCICNPGANCNPDRTKRIEISSIEITRFPAKNAMGNDWDSTGLPDLHLALYLSTEKLFATASTINEASNDTVYVINCIPPVRLENYEENHTFYLYDDDGNKTDQFIGGVVFKPYSEGNQKASFKVVDTNGEVAFKLNWQFYYI